MKVLTRFRMYISGMNDVNFGHVSECGFSVHNNGKAVAKMVNVHIQKR